MHAWLWEGRKIIETLASEFESIVFSAARNDAGTDTRPFESSLFRWLPRKCVIGPPFSAGRSASIDLTTGCDPAASAIMWDAMGYHGRNWASKEFGCRKFGNLAIPT
jgi:hypothetical protein